MSSILWLNDINDPGRCKVSAVKLVCLGEPLMEFNQCLDGTYKLGAGGDTSNCAISASRQGAAVGHVTRVGGDRFGRMLLDLWASEDIDASEVVVDEAAHTGIYVVSHGPDGHAFDYFRKNSAASRMRPVDLPREYIQNARFLHVSGISQAVSNSAADTVFAAIELARNAGVKISYDTNLRLALWPLARAAATIHGAMSRCHIALPSLEDARQLTGLTDAEAIAEFYKQLGSEVVALTMGSAGVLVKTKQRSESIPALPVSPLDATAAGDTFSGAFLASLLDGCNPFEAGEYASVAAALATQGHGAVDPMPRRPEVEAALRVR